MVAEDASDDAAASATSRTHKSKKEAMCHARGQLEIDDIRSALQLLKEERKGLSI
jgi:hypothetical protein